MAVLCAADLENLINDFDTFMYSGATSDVVLSDLHSMPSYRKFSIDELSRTGNIWSSLKTYLIDDVITKNNKMFVAIRSNINKDPEVETLDWKEIKKDGTTAGFGISAYCSFLVKTGDILASKYIESITIINDTEFQITVNDAIRVGVGNRLVFGASYSSEDIDETLIKLGTATNTPLEYFIFWKVVQNDDNILRVKYNGNKVSWNARLDFIFLEV
jgi:hypothetical protein